MFPVLSAFVAAGPLACVMSMTDTLWYTNGEQKGDLLSAVIMSR